MAVAVIVDFPYGNAQKYEQVTGKLFPEGKLPEGWRVHIAGPAGNGWQVVNVVPSRELADTDREKRMQWIASVEQVEALDPAVVVASHKRPDAPDDDPAAVLSGTKTYIRDFDQSRLPTGPVRRSRRPAHPAVVSPASSMHPAIPTHPDHQYPP